MPPKPIKGIPAKAGAGTAAADPTEKSAIEDLTIHLATMMSALKVLVKYRSQVPDLQKFLAESIIALATHPDKERASSLIKTTTAYLEKIELLKRLEARQAPGVRDLFDCDEFELKLRRPGGGPALVISTFEKAGGKALASPAPATAAVAAAAAPKLIDPETAAKMAGLELQIAELSEKLRGHGAGSKSATKALAKAEILREEKAQLEIENRALTEKLKQQSAQLAELREELARASCLAAEQKRQSSAALLSLQAQILHLQAMQEQALLEIEKKRALNVKRIDDLSKVISKLLAGIKALSASFEELSNSKGFARAVLIRAMERGAYSAAKPTVEIVKDTPIRSAVTATAIAIEHMELVNPSKDLSDQSILLSIIRALNDEFKVSPECLCFHGSLVTPFYTDDKVSDVDVKIVIDSSQLSELSAKLIGHGFSVVEREGYWLAKGIISGKPVDLQIFVGAHPNKFEYSRWHSHLNITGHYTTCRYDADTKTVALHYHPVDLIYDATGKPVIQFVDKYGKTKAVEDLRALYETFEARDLFFFLKKCCVLSGIYNTDALRQALYKTILNAENLTIVRTMYAHDRAGAGAKALGARYLQDLCGFAEYDPTRTADEVIAHLRAKTATSITIIAGHVMTAVGGAGARGGLAAGH